MGFALNENKREHLFYHTSLQDRKESFKKGEEEILLVVECVITKSVKGHLDEYFSGGYFTINPFENMVKPTLMPFIKGSPRDLLMNIDD